MNLGTGFSMDLKAPAVIILAAGKGTRMKSSLAKALQPFSGQPLLAHVLKAVNPIKPLRTIVVVGYQSEAVKSRFGGEPVEFAEQTEQLGTGHAVMQAEQALGDFSGAVLILCADMPLIKTQTLRKLLERHEQTQAQCTLLVLKTPEVRDFGRVFQDGEGNVSKIVEAKDCSPEEKTVDEYNAGVYCFDKESLFNALREVGCDNEQREYYLTDTIGYLADRQNRVQSIITRDSEEILGVNTEGDLQRAEQIFLKNASTL